MLIVSIPGLHVIHQARIFAIVRSHSKLHSDDIQRETDKTLWKRKGKNRYNPEPKKHKMKKPNENYIYKIQLLIFTLHLYLTMSLHSQTDQVKRIILCKSFNLV